MKKSLLAFATALLSLCASAQESASTTFDGVATTWVRTNNATWSFNHANGYVETNNPDETNQFIALYGFEYQLPEGMKVRTATLRIVTERYKGAPMIVHGYGNDFADKTTWGTESEYITPLFDQAPLATFTPACQWNKSVSGDVGITEDKCNAEAWTNYIDVTPYVKTKTVNDRRVNFVLYQERGKKTNQNCFFTHETNDVVNSKNEISFTLKAEDIRPQLVVTFEVDSETGNDVLEPVADTFVRAGNTVKHGSDGNMEIKKQGSETELTNQFYGLMSFRLPSEIVDGTHEVTSARLRLVCVQNKGDRAMSIYRYPSTFDEANAIWNTEENNVKEALASEPIAEFSINGQGTKSLGDGGISETYRKAEAWTNYIDLTDYLKANPADLNILISKKNLHNESMRIATRETGDIENTKTDAANPFTFKAEDLKPCLYITYTRKNIGTGVDDIVVDDDAPVEYYNLQGMRVENPTSGLYIRRQGNKATKILIR